MKVIAMLAQKGGTGKTTLAQALATAMASQRTTRLLDLDPQGTAMQWGVRRQANGLGPPEVAAVAQRSITAALHKAETAGVEVCVIDTPPHIETAVIDTASLADLILVPTQPAMPDFGGIAATIQVCRSNQIKAPFYAVINQAFPVGTRNDEFVEELGNYGIPACPHFIIRRVAHQDSSIVGKTAPEYQPTNPAAGEVQQLHDWAVAQLFSNVPTDV